MNISASKFHGQGRAGRTDPAVYTAAPDPLQLSQQRTARCDRPSHKSHPELTSIHVKKPGFMLDLLIIVSAAIRPGEIMAKHNQKMVKLFPKACKCMAGAKHAAILTQNRHIYQPIPQTQGPPNWIWSQQRRQTWLRWCWSQYKVVPGFLHQRLN